MSNFFTRSGLSFNGTLSPFDINDLSSSSPSDLPRTYSIVMGRPLENVRIDVSNIHVTIGPPASAGKGADVKPVSQSRPKKNR